MDGKSKGAPRSPGWGYFFVTMAALLWGVSGPAAKFLFQSGVTPFQLIQQRLTLASVCIFLWLFAKNRSLLKISREDVTYFMVLGMCGIAGAQFTYLYAVSKIKVAPAVLLQYMAPIFIAIFTVFVLKERVKPAALASIVMASAGCFLVVGAYDFDFLSLNLAGIGSGLASAVFFAWYSIHGEYGMRKYNPWTVLFYAFFFGAVLWNVLHPPFEAFMHSYSPAQWWWICYVAIFGTGLPFGLYLEGVNLIRSARASVTGTLEPITAGIVSFLFLGESMAPPQFVGAFLVLSAIVLLRIGQEADDKAPALIRAGRASQGHAG